MNKFAMAIIVIMSVILGFMFTHLLALESEVRSVGDQVVMQTATLNRSLKNIVPLVLPKGIEDEIVKVEEQLKNESTWPKATQGIQQLNDSLAKVVNKLPPWAQEEMLPRLLPRRWETEALWILASKPSTEALWILANKPSTDADRLPTYADSLSTYVSSIESHLSNKPTDSSDEIEKSLKEMMQITKEEIPKAERSAAIKAADLAIKSKKDVEVAARQLVVYDDKEAKSLLKDLNDILLEQSFTQEIGYLEKYEELTKKLTDVPLREYAIVKIHQAVMDLRLRRNSSGIKGSPLDEKINSLGIKVENNIKEAGGARQLRDAEKLKQYQVWALNEIKKVRPFKTIEDIEINKIPDMVDRNISVSGARTTANGRARRVLIDELVAHMAPINQAILEPAVSQWFGKVYQKQFSELSNETDQLEVVTRFATAIKRAVE